MTNPNQNPEQAISAASVWTRPSRAREQLTRERIVTEAIALLDNDGLEALTMRTLGSRLSAGATSLYRHVANRDELIELVVDEVYGEIEVPDQGHAGAWRDSVTSCADSVRAMILRHPWTATLLGGVGLAYLGPNVLRLNEELLALFESGGFDVAEAELALSAVMSYVIGISITEAAWLSAIARSGLTEDQWIAGLRPAIEHATENHPHLKASAEIHDQDPKQGREENFRYGLDRMLDGLEPRR
jgi:AcrR family transcriptional regulator